MSKIRVRYESSCVGCSQTLRVGDEAHYVPGQGVATLTCLACVAPPTYSYGEAGASARKEHERRSRNHQRRVEESPIVSRLILAGRQPQHVKAWAVGAEGEERLGRTFAPIVGEDFIVIHDARVPGSRANIDHIVVTSQALWVIDAKKYKGRPELRRRGGLLEPRVEELWVAGRNRTKLVSGVQWQMSVVQNIVGDVPVRGMLCFIEADFPLIGGAFSIQDVSVCWPRRALKTVKKSREGPVDSAVIDKLVEGFKL